MESLEDVWANREETLYPALFGSTSRGIFTLNRALFADVFETDRIDPRWLFLGMFEFAPTAHRLARHGAFPVTDPRRRGLG